MNDINYIVFIAIVVVLILLTMVTGIVYLAQKALREKDANLFKRIIETQELEQERIGRDLHDEIGPKVAGIASMMAVFQHKSEKPQEIETIGKYLAELRKEIRSISHNLVSPTFKQMGLVNALEDLCSKLETPGISVNFSVASDFQKIKEFESFQIYRIATELILNAIKHSGGSVIKVRLYQDVKHFTLSVMDNGNGVIEVINERSGLGIQSIRSRIDYFEGGLHFKQVNPKGINALVSIALKKLVK